MQPNKNLDMVQRFVQLPLAQRRLFLQKLEAKGMSLGQFALSPLRSDSGPWPLSYAQERQWFLWQLEPASAASHVPSILRLSGALDVPALQRALDALVLRHESLRTLFVETDDGLRQHVLEQLPVAIRIVDCAGEQVDAAIEAEVARPFDLRQGPLLRLQLLRENGEQHVLVLTLHHVITDAWSMQRLVSELVQLYAGECSGVPTELPTLPIQYADYALWQRSWMEAGEGERQLGYWRQALDGEQPLLELPVDRPRPPQQSYKGDRVVVQLPTGLGAALQALARAEGLTPFVVLLASFQALLHRYCAQPDIRVGVPIANRTRLETQGLIGFFVNTQVLRAELDGQMSFRELLAQVRTRTQEAQAHQELPFEQLVEALQPERSLSHSPLFQVMFNHQSGTGSAAALKGLPGLEVEALEPPTRTSHFDLVLDTWDSDGQLHAALSYATDLFEHVTVERLGRHWANLLQAALSDPAQRLGELPLMAAAESAALAAQWDHSHLRYPAGRYVHQLFEERARQAPDALALIFAEQTLTYGELNRRANRLAHGLIARGIGAEQRVAIALPRSAESLVSFLAVLKAGGAYVPLDVEYPLDRLQYMIEDSRAALIISDCQRAAHLGLPAEQLLTLDGSYDAQLYPDSNPDSALADGNLAYVIYTSGSTGLPKGVAVEHGPLVMHIQATGERYQTGPTDCELHFMSFAFDGSHEGWMHPLINGARVLIRDDSLWSPEHTYAQMHRHGVTIGVFPPIYLQQLAEHAEVDGQPPAVRVYCAGGDAVSQASYELMRRTLRPDWFFNGYGPTETVVTPLIWKAGREDECQAAYAPIGNLVGNRSGYILDANLALQPDGLAGELYLGGQGVARGYLQRPALTAERFVPDPFASNGARLYRSGDLTRYNAAGVVEYLGRVDHQVKIRGFRIELGEIEARLLELPTINEAVVVAHESAAGKRLVAYLVATEAVVDAEAQMLLRERVRDGLKVHLPDYMIPAHFVLLPRMPLTPNGKLDRKALPAPDLSQAQREFVAPRTDLQQRLARVWQGVLKLERIGLYDNFFELGGDSIISLQVVSRARREGIALTPKDVFEHQTIHGLATVARQVQAAEVDQAPVTGAAPLTPIQQAFFQRALEHPEHWNQSLLLTPREALQAEPLQRALNALLSHHDALRLRFRYEDGEWRAHYSEVAEAELLWQTSVSDAAAFSAFAEQAQRSLDLAAGPLLRAVLVQWADGSQRLLLIVHHLAVDGVSWRLLLEDLQLAYSAALLGQPPAFAAKTHAFKAWAERLQALAHSPEKLAELAFWQAQLEGQDDRLPGQRTGVVGRIQQTRTVRSRLSAEMTRKLLQQAPAAYRTQINDLLLSALARVLCDWSGRPDALIRLEGHGREALFDDLDISRTLGWFTALYPLRLTPGATPGASIKGIKEQLRTVPDKGVGYGLLRYLGPEQARSSLEALAEGAVLFNYLGQFDQSFEHGWLSPAQESAGASQDPEAAVDAPLCINGQIYAGVLELGWSFSAEVLDGQAIEALAEAYTRTLEQLIEHCCEAQSGALTPSDVPLAGLDQAHLDALPVAPAEIEDVYPLAPLQQGMLFHALYGAGRGDYVNQMRVDVQGLDVAAFNAAWQAVVQQHEVLRASFLASAEPPLQIIRRARSMPCVELDWRNADSSAEALTAWAAEDRRGGFDLLNDCLLRLTLLRTGETQHHLILTSHHIVLDGWSLSQLLAEVLQGYAGKALQRGAGRYRDYIAWLQRQSAEASERFWRGQLAALGEPTRLASALAPQHAGSGYAEHLLSLDTVQSQALSEFARSQRVTLNTLVQAAWILLLQRYSGLDTVTFGATVAGRPGELAGIEQQLGLFINTLPVLSSPQPELSVANWLTQLQAQNLALREHEHTPLYDIQRWAGFAGAALFDTVLVFENYPVAEALQQGPLAGVRFGEVISQEQTHYPLTLVVGANAQLSFQFNYACAHFDAAGIQRLAGYFSRLLRALARDATAALGVLPMLEEDEQGRIINELNRTAAPYPHEQCLHALIEAQATQTPDATALLFAQQRLSYAELNRRANQVAHQLRERGVGPDVLVGIAAERSVEMVVGLLAILKAGGAYVPLDPDYPRERLSYMIEDSGIRLLLTQSHLRGQLPIPQGVECLLLEDAGAGYPVGNLKHQATSANLAYVIYTSGSTGRPKGAGNSHQALVNRLHWMQKAYGLDGSDTVLQKTPFSFDVSVWEFFWPLLSGARLALAQPGDHRDPQKLIECIHDFQVSTLHFVPSMLQAFMASPGVEGCSGIRRLICSGEALGHELAQQVLTRLLNAALYNLYGPTEAAIDVTHWTCEKTDDSVPIGRPIDNLKTHVLSPGLLPVPQGVNSELYLGGVGLARGYHGRPGLTAERFVPDPFDDGGGRLYRTGDLARYRADGAIEYAGRLDHQVKIRGLRIELGEIDARAQEYPQVREAVVIDIDGPLGKQLVGYLVPREEGSDPREGLKAHLKAGLPDYMVPAQWILLEAMPLSPNGKLDRKALPSADTSLLHSLYVEPQTELQQQLAAIWADVLKVERVGLDDDFFELGGHSLLSLTVISRIQLQLGHSLKPELLFQFPKLSEFADALNVVEEDSFEEKLRRLSFFAEDLESVE